MLQNVVVNSKQKKLTKDNKKYLNLNFKEKLSIDEVNDQEVPKTVPEIWAMSEVVRDLYNVEIKKKNVFEVGLFNGRFYMHMQIVRIIQDKL